MQDGWFEGLPYFLQGLRPQGFLGRRFARDHAALLQLSENPQDRSGDDALHLWQAQDEAPIAAGRELAAYARLAAQAADAALRFWSQAAQERQVSAGFRTICGANHETLLALRRRI